MSSNYKEIIIRRRNALQGLLDDDLFLKASELAESQYFRFRNCYYNGFVDIIKEFENKDNLELHVKRQEDIVHFELTYWKYRNGHTHCEPGSYVNWVSKSNFNSLEEAFEEMCKFKMIKR